MYMKNGAVFWDSMHPENEEEKGQVKTFISYFHTNRATPISDPILQFVRTFPGNVSLAQTKAVGKSINFSNGPNHIFIRQSGSSLIVVELVSVDLARNSGVPFFVGVAETSR